MIVPRYRVTSDTESIQDPQGLKLMKKPEAAYSLFWDLIPFRENIRQLTYEMASRSITSRTVVLENQILDSDVDIDLTSATKARVTASHVLYHPDTKQRFVLDSINQTTGTAIIRDVVQAHGGVRTTVPDGATLIVLSSSEHFDEINAESRFEETSVIENYVQDMTELLEWSVADIRELRKWSVTKSNRLTERMRDIVKDLNMSLIYGAPLKYDDDSSSMTAGFDYVVEKAGNAIEANELGTADIGDIRSILKQLQLNGVGPGDGLVLHMGVNTYYAYEAEGLANISLEGTPGEGFVVGNEVKGLQFAGIGFVPFYPDPMITDDRVRFVCTKHAGKAFYEGLGEGAIVESVRVIDEPSKSTSKVKKSSIQQKWGTIWENAESVHFILITGIE